MASRHQLAEEDFSELAETYTGSREDFEKIIAEDEDILHDGRKWGFNDTVVRERIGHVAKELGLEVFN